MSGVCAVIRLDGAPAHAGEIEAMCAAAKFRGPDGAGTWMDGPAALGQLATWIAPEDEGYLGPYVAEDLIVVADARIDNREELASRTRVERCAPDAALLAAAFRRWGNACAEHLVGDFAALIWDRRSRRLFAARDPSGLRTLVYRHEPRRRLLVASEIRQLLAVPEVRRRIDEGALGAHLCGPFVRPHRTFYAGIAQLPPAWALEVGQGEPRRWRFWSPDLDHRMRFADEDERAAAVRTALQTAVRDRRRSMAPVGLSLSGGIDSGSVAAALGSVAGEETMGPVTTYSWAFEEILSADEREVSDALAETLGFEAVPIPGDDGYPLAGWPAVAPHHDDPFHWPYERLNQRTYEAAAANGAKVLLSGAGGDEAFGDWIWDYPGMLAGGAVTDLIRRLRRHRELDGRSLPSLVLREVLAPAWQARRPRAPLMAVHPSSRAAWQTLSGQIQGAVDLPALAAEERAAVPPLRGSGRMLRYMRVFGGHARRTAAADQLAHAEHGVVKAEPLTDRRLLELVLSIPQYNVTRRDRGKALLLDAVAPLRPSGVAFRSGFVPDALWERGMCERSVNLVRALLKGARLDTMGFTRPGLLAREYERQLAGHTSFDLVWAIGAELWLRTHWPEVA